MKTIFDTAIRNALIERIKMISPTHKAEWGKMNVFQMLKHCTKWEEMALGKVKYKQTFLGKLFGKIALKDFISDETPFKQNVPTVPEFKIKEENGDIENQKLIWISLIEEYAEFSNTNFIHPFFGLLTKEQLGYLAYKHTDHHLRQFNS